MSAAKKVKLDRGLAASGRGKTLGGGAAAASRSGGGSSPALGSLSVELLATIFGYLSWKDILRARVCRTFREAATRTLVPLDRHKNFTAPEFRVNSSRRYDALRWMSRALPNMQRIHFYGMGDAAFEDGIDPEKFRIERHVSSWLPRQRRRRQDILQIDIIANFPKLRELCLEGIQLNGRYPCLLGFDNLRTLSLSDIEGLKLDLSEIAGGLPALERLCCSRLPRLRGSAESLRVLSHTLKAVFLTHCPAVNGDLMDFADLPLLKTLWMSETPIRGDVRRIGDNDFPVLRELKLPISVNGSGDRHFERVADAKEVMDALCRLKKRNGTQIGRMAHEKYPMRWHLANDSPDRYQFPNQRFEDRCRGAPFLIEIVKVGPCIGWRWSNFSGGVCKTNWIDEGPDREWRDAQYWEEADCSIFKDCVDPPTEAEYRRIVYTTFGAAFLW